MVHLLDKKKLNYALFSEKDIPSHFLDEERNSKQASSSVAPVSILSLHAFPEKGIIGDVLLIYDLDHCTVGKIWFFTH